MLVFEGKVAAFIARMRNISEILLEVPHDVVDDYNCSRVQDCQRQENKTRATGTAPPRPHDASFWDNNFGIPKC